MAEGYAECHTDSAGQTRWRITDKGKEGHRAGMQLRNPTRTLKPRSDVPFDEMTVYELMTLLDRVHWLCTVVCKEEVKALRGTPYRHGESTRVWFLRDNGKVDRRYLEALLAALQPGAEVPHFARPDVYKELLGLEVEPKLKRRREMFCIQGGLDELDVPAAALRDRPRRQRIPQEALPWVEDVPAILDIRAK